MQGPFYRWYKRKFDRLSENPPEDSWENISSALDKQQAVVKGSGKGLKGYGLASLLILVAMGVGYFIGSNKGEALFDTLRQAQGEQLSVTGETNGHTSTPLRQDFDVAQSRAQDEQLSVIKEAEHHTSTTRSMASNPSSAGTLANSAEGAEETSNVINETALITNEHEGQAMQYLPTKNNFLTTENQKWQLGGKMNPVDEEMDKKLGVKNFPSGFYVGSNIAVNNYWLLNYDTYNGFKRSELNRVKLNFGLTYGFAAGYRCGNNMAVQAEWIQASKQGQKYIEYREGHYMERDVALFYHQANLLFKKGHTRMIGGTTQLISVNLLAGTHVALLTSAEELMGADIYSVTEHYKKVSYGATAGLETELLTKYNVLFSLGLRGSAGLNNVFAGNDKMPSDFLQTRNAALSIDAGISYLISNPKKN